MHTGNDKHVKIYLMNIVAAAISLVVEHILFRDNKYVRPEPAIIVGTKSNAATVNNSSMLHPT